MYRVAIITKNRIVGKNFNSLEEGYAFILKLDEEEGVLKYRILDKNTKKIVEKGE